MNPAKKRPRVLVLAPRYPYPVIGGDRLRIHRICLELSRSCDLTLLSLCDNYVELSSPAPSDGVFSCIEKVYLPQWRSIFNVLMGLPSRLPLQISYYRSPRFAARIQALIPQHDVCLAHLIRTGSYVRNASTPCVLEMTDAISLNYQRVVKQGKRKDWRTWVYQIEVARLLKYEREILCDFDATSLVSEVDRKFLLEGHQSERVFVCSNGVDLDGLPYRERTLRESAVVFIGNMTTMQNLDACIHFAEEVLPLLRLQGAFSFRVIGKMTPTIIEKLRRYEGVVLLPNVDNISEAVGNAFAAVAPMRLGAGVQNKVLEYMALGLPAVVSPVGLEGLAAKPGREIMTALNPEQFLQHLMMLWSEPERAIDMARAARAYVEHQHVWGIQLAPMVDAIHRLVQSRRPAS